MKNLFRKIIKKIITSGDRTIDKIKNSGPIRVEKGVSVANEIEIGAYTFIGANVILGPNLKGVGKFCSIGSGSILGPNQHPINQLSTSAVFYSKSWGISGKHLKDSYNSQCVILENDVWIGHNVIVSGNVKIGNGAIIAAGSVVTKDVPSFTIVGGVPAKIIRDRFDKAQKQKIMNMKWWDQPIEIAFDFYNKFKDLNES